MGEDVSIARLRAERWVGCDAAGIGLRQKRLSRRERHCHSYRQTLSHGGSERWSSSLPAMLRQIPAVSSGMGGQSESALHTRASLPGSHASAQLVSFHIPFVQQAIAVPQSEGREQRSRAPFDAAARDDFAASTHRVLPFDQRHHGFSRGHATALHVAIAFDGRQIPSEQTLPKGQEAPPVTQISCRQSAAFERRSTHVKYSSADAKDKQQVLPSMQSELSSQS